jgi:hypothetical protein
MSEKKTRRKPFRLPKKVKIKGVVYKVQVVEDLRDDDGVLCDGLHCPKTHTISVAKDTKGQYRRRVFIHEVFHGYVYECHLREVISSEVEELIVEALACGTDEQFYLEVRE